MELVLLQADSFDVHDLIPLSPCLSGPSPVSSDLEWCLFLFLFLPPSVPLPPFSFNFPTRTAEYSLIRFCLQSSSLASSDLLLKDR